MHQQEVLAVGLETYLIGHTGCHRHGRNTGRTNQRVDRIFGECVHQLRHEYTCSGTDHKGNQTQNDDRQGAAIQEGIRAHFVTNGQAEEDGHDVDQGVLGSIAQTLHNTGFFHQVTEAEHTQQRSSRRQQYGDQHQYSNREDDFFTFRDGAQLAHGNLTLRFAGQRLHDRRLNQRHQRHVGIRGYRNRTQQFRSQFRCNKDRRRAIRTTNDTDCCSLLNGKVHQTGIGQQNRTGNRTKDTKLSSSTEQQGLRVSQQRTKVRHRAHTHEDQQRSNTTGNGHAVKDIQHTAVKTERRAQRHSLLIHQALYFIGFFVSGKDFVHAGIGGQAEQVSKLSQYSHIARTDGGFSSRPAHACTRDVHHQGTHGNRQQQQRFKAFLNGQVQHTEGHQHHKCLATFNMRNTRVIPEAE